MADYLHGAYGRVSDEGIRNAAESSSAIVIVGTAPVHTIEGGAEYVNKPLVINGMTRARRLLGYSDDWAKYTLCQAMHHFLETVGIGPVVVINVLDPAVHKAASDTTISKTPEGGVITILNAEDIILDSVKVQTIPAEEEEAQTKVKGTDYTIAYADGKITITGIDGALGTAALNVVYRTIDAAAVNDAAVIGTTDDAGLNTGLHAIRNVYPETGIIPAYLIVPGFSSHPAVHAAMAEVTENIEGHWKAYMFTDIPINDGTSDITLQTAKAWKDANGYNRENETVYFPMAKGTDGKKYYLSVLAAANFLQELDENGGLPYHSASNTSCGIIERLYMGEANEKRVFDDEIINRYLNKNGIASATFTAGEWVIWGAHSADYDQNNADSVNVAETNRMMLFYLANDFQARRSRDVDKPMSRNDILSIVAEEQARLDALVGMGALLFGEAVLNADLDTRSDIINGDFLFDFNVTTTPLAKSLTAHVKWVDDGFSVLYDQEAGNET